MQYSILHWIKDADMAKITKYGWLGGSMNNILYKIMILRLFIFVYNLSDYSYF